MTSIFILIIGLVSWAVKKMENLFQQTDIELQRMHFYFQELERWDLKTS